MLGENCFSHLGMPNRIWTVSAVHGELSKLQSVHQAIGERFTLGDRVVYLGNYIGGLSNNSIEIIDEILSFRRSLLARPGMRVTDISYLRGMQEEMWQKLLQLQFAPNPLATLEWMLEKGLKSTLESYGGSVKESLSVAPKGIMSITRWTNSLRQNMREYAGHEKFYSSLKRAAYTEDVKDGQNHLLFVNSGIDVSKSLMEQGDSFWWAGKCFDDINHAYDPFSYVIRGYDPEQKGVHVNGVTMSLDGGCGYGGELVCAEISGKGQVSSLLGA